MLQHLFKKWWVILLQGILLIILSTYIFNRPGVVLAGISFWFGLMVLVAGLLGIISWIASDKAERASMSLLWSVVSFAFGILMLFNLLATMKTLTVIFGFWVLVSGFMLLKNGWSLKALDSLGWVMVIFGVLSIIAGVMMIFNIGIGAVGIATLLGWQVLLTGISLIVLSFGKKKLESGVKERISNLKQG